MNELWQTRRKNYHRRMLKYLRYVFNDHFVLVLVFLLGGLLFGYSGWLSRLTALQATQPVMVKLTALFACGWLLAWLQLGQVATLLSDADTVFLGPKQAQMKHWLCQARNYSLLVSLPTQVIVAACTLPLLHVALGMKPLQLGAVVLVQCLLKALQLQASCEKLTHMTTRTHTQWLVRLVIPVVSYVLALTWLGAICAVVVLAALLIVRWSLFAKAPTPQFNWLLAINHEQARLGRLLKIFSLFCQVDLPPVAAKRRRYADWWVKVLAGDTAASYLITRQFVRSQLYYNLFWRLAVVAAVLINLSENSWLALVLAVLFMYLLALQLVPLWTQQQQQIFNRIYPIPAPQWQASWLHLTRQLLAWFGAIVALAWLCGSGWQHPLTSLVVVAGIAGWGLILSWLYLPAKVRQK